MVGGDAGLGVGGRGSAEELGIFAPGGFGLRGFSKRVSVFPTLRNRKGVPDFRPATWSDMWLFLILLNDTNVSNWADPLMYPPSWDTKASSKASKGRWGGMLMRRSLVLITAG